MATCQSSITLFFTFVITVITCYHTKGMVKIDQPPKKSHNTPVPYPTTHHLVTEMCTMLLQNGALWNTGLVHCGICATALLQHAHSPGYGCNHYPQHWYLFILKFLHVQHILWVLTHWSPGDEGIILNL